ncbi:putative E3 ubiquitin-protein ligase MARCH [Rosa chinensis]|uniref:Putative E3 ubiquitin-protein ligase MARCH n=1 Tax=Rosa chinensis TaxID=74649 RepID=A0A2P6QTD7_ROSCH|nr:putative E3 ubiquitin-protein ligase MARCH [Rosa chinensis]
MISNDLFESSPVMNCTVCVLYDEKVLLMQPYQPGYTAPSPPPQSDDTTVDISEAWTISGTPLDLRDLRLLAIEFEYDEYADTSANGAAFCRSGFFIFDLFSFSAEREVGGVQEVPDSTSCSGICDVMVKCTYRWIQDCS